MPTHTRLNQTLAVATVRWRVRALHHGGLSPVAVWRISRDQNRCDYSTCWLRTCSHASLHYSLTARMLMVPVCTFELCISKEKDVLTKVQCTNSQPGSVSQRCSGRAAGRLDGGVLNTHTSTHTHAPSPPRMEAGLHRKRDLFPLIQVCRYTLLIKQPFSPVYAPLPPSHVL